MFKLLVEFGSDPLIVKFIGVLPSAQKVYEAELGLLFTFDDPPPKPLRKGVLLLQLITFTWTSLITLPIKTPFLYSLILMAIKLNENLY